MENKKYDSSGVLSVNKDEDTIERLKLMYEEIVNSLPPMFKAAVKKSLKYGLIKKVKLI